MLPAGLGFGDGNTALQAGFLACYIAPPSLEGGLPWYQVWEAAGALPN